MTLDPILQSAVTRLSAQVPRLLLVGGAVRDLLLGIPTKDADVEVYGMGAQDLEKTLRKLFGQVDTVGASFGIYKVSLEEGRMLDVAIPRKESKTGKGHKGFQVIGDPNLPLEEAFKRRDFTLNAIGMNVETGELVDPYNGQKDLHEKILRVVDAGTFVDDPLRVFRGIQFMARFGLTVEPDTLLLMKRMVEEGMLDELSRERVTDEWKKLLLKSPRPSRGLALMRELDIVEHYYPELAATIGTPQDPEWHPEGDVWTHTLMVVDEAAEILGISSTPLPTFLPSSLTIMLAALCHDFGKPLVTRQEDGRWRAKGHEEAGALPAKAFVSRGTFGDDIARDVVAITKDHLKPTQLYRAFQKGDLDEKKYANAVRRLLKRLGGVPLEAYLAVTEADMRGRGGVKRAYDEGAFLRSVVKKYDLEQVAKTPLITGAELMADFGIPSGPRIGELMKAVEVARDEGEIETRDDAREFIRAMLH